MKASTLAPIAALLAASLAGCGEVAPPPPVGDEAAIADEHGALLLAPRIDVQGLDDVFETLALDHLDFDAELFVLPTDNRSAHPGAVVAIRVAVDDGVARTESLDGLLELDAAGRYRVLLRIDPSEDGVSVNVDGAVDESPAVARAKGIAEPAPIAADGGDDEPAPTPAEPAPTPARGKADQPGIDPGATRGSGAPISVSSRASFEFFVGVVEIERGDTELVITWDVRTWLRELLAEPLGIAPEAEGDAATGVPGAFADFAAHFQLIAQ